MSTISSIRAREILDSRGRPTVEVDVITSDGIMGRVSVPSGASTGRHEALELRDGDPTRHAGRGVLHAISNVDAELSRAVIGMDVTDQRAIDSKLCECDGTAAKSRLGANAILGVSMAAARAAAAVRQVPLWHSLSGGRAPIMPMPMVNMISGGLHASGGVDLQDFLVIPVSSTSCRHAIEMVLEVHRKLGDILTGEGLTTLMADEGGYGPPLESNERALTLIVHAIDEAGYHPGDDIAIAIDVASAHFHDPVSGQYILRHPSRSLTSDEMVQLLSKWVEKYPIISIEDGCGEDDWEGWEKLTRTLRSRVQLVGDDLFTTNAARLREGIRRGAANSILVKMNQIGTITEALDVCAMAMEYGYRPVVSARSGETEDSFLADLAVASGAGQIKVGCVRTSERLSKYNQLMRIEEAVGSQATYPGRKALAP